MANASRFPHLALPFAVVGAAAGWLSVGLLANPLLAMLRPGRQGVASVCAMVFAAATGALLTRWCVPRRYAYELDAPEPDTRAPTDTWARHVIAVLVAGTATGTAVAIICSTYRGPLRGASSGFCCAMVFLPVCVAVVSAARRAQRARLGSIVAGSDRRAVWGILAMTMAVTTLEAVLDWPAAMTGRVETPIPALFMVLVAGATIAGILAADLLAVRRARRAVGQGLTAQDPSESPPEDEAVPRLDLGLGDDSWARLARSPSAYRGRDRTLALVQGSPEQALSALQRAVRRGVIGLVVTGAVCGAHAAASTDAAQLLYELTRCETGEPGSCTRAADLVRPRDLDRAMRLYAEACEDDDGAACATLAEIYETGERRAAVSADPEASRKYAHAYHERACDAGAVPSCARASSTSPSRFWFNRPW